MALEPVERVRTLLVCGSRSGVRWERVWDELDDALRHYGPFARVIEGCARGVDRDAEAWAAERDIQVTHFPADWQRHGQIAGVLRNKRMLDEHPDLVVAFYADAARPSRGTSHMVKIARVAGITTIEINARAAA